MGKDDPFGDYSDKTEVGVGFSDTALLAVSLVGFAVMAFLIYSILISRVQTSDELEKGGEDGEQDYEEELLRADVASLNRAQRRARAKLLMKRERRVVHGEGQEEDHAGEDHHDAHLSRKERQKAAKAAEKKERHFNDDKRREEQRQAIQLAQEEKQKRKELEAGRAKEEKIRRQEEEEEKKLDAWKAFTTFLASPDGSVSITVEEWVKELERGPTVLPLVDLTKRFDVSLERVKTRINELVSAGRVTGILDEHLGAFLVFSHDNLLSLGSFIRNKGEVSLGDISMKAKELVE